MKIKPVSVGYPAKEATDLSVDIITFNTEAKNCILYYQLKNVVEETENELKIETVLADGNLTLTESEYDAWGQPNKYIEDLALTKLQLERLV